MTAQTLARGMLKRAFLGRVIARRLPAAFGAPRIFVSPESRLAFLRPDAGAFDPRLLEWATRYVQPGDVVWDIGGNVGIFTLAAAGRGASVLTVEPDPFLANLLVRARNANPTLDFSVLAAAVSDERGVATLEIAAAGRASNRLKGYAAERVGGGRTVSEVMVPTVTLDDLLSVSTPHFIKIDVEGAEAAVFRGAARVLSEARPVIVAEVGRAHRPEIHGLLLAAGYTLMDAEHGGPAGERTHNLLALPA